MPFFIVFRVLSLGQFLYQHGSEQRLERLENTHNNTAAAAAASAAATTTPTCVCFAIHQVPRPLAEARRRGDHDDGGVATALRDNPPRLREGLGGDGRDRLRPRRGVPGDRAGETSDRNEGFCTW